MTFDELNQAVQLVADYQRLKTLDDAMKGGNATAVLEVKPSGSVPPVRENMPAETVRQLLKNRIDAVKAALALLGVVAP